MRRANVLLASARTTCTFEGTKVPSKILPYVQYEVLSYESTYEGSQIATIVRKYFRTFVLSYFRKYGSTEVPCLNIRISI